MNLLIISQHFWPESFIINNLSEEIVKKKNKSTCYNWKAKLFIRKY